MESHNKLLPYLLIIFFEEIMPFDYDKQKSGF